jgi:1,4-dihydroxy-2-naphthoate octaprenyltransferase
LAVGAFCGLAAYLYSGGARPIAYTAFGEVIAGGLMGCVGINTAFFLQTSVVTTGSAMVSAPAAILIGVILSANNIRDMDNDRASGRKTLVILLGRKRSVIYLAAAYATAFAWIVCLAAAGIVSVWSLLGLFGMLPAWRSVILFTRHRAPKDLMLAMKRAAQTNTLAGMLFSSGMLLGYFLDAAL